MVIIDPDDNSREEVAQLLDGFCFVEVIGTFDNIISANDFIQQARPPLMLFDVTNNIDLALDSIEKLTNKYKNMIIIAVSAKVDADIIIKTMRAGAREFLPKPIEKEDLNKALKKARITLTQEEGSSDGKIYSVFSNKGGIGKTTLATNLALQLARRTGEKVCLIDLNLQMGDVATFLDINPSFDISYVVSNLGRLDKAFLQSSLEKYKDYDLYILAEPLDIEQAEEISADDINTLLSFLKTMFGYIVVDTDSNFDVKTLTCLDVSDYILLILMVNLPSIRNCQKCLSLFRRLEYNEDKVKLVVNRYIENEEITLEDVEEALSRQIYWKIPNNYFDVMSSINKGIPISESNPDLEVSKNFTQLAERIHGIELVKEEAEESSSLFGFLTAGGLKEKIKELTMSLIKSSDK
jgi:pilus assembly protein CpaE